MKAVFLFLTLVSAVAHGNDNVMRCQTEILRTATKSKSFSVELISSNTKGWHTMRIAKIEGARRTKLPAVPIFYRSAGNVSTMVAKETGQVVVAYRNAAAPTREGFVVIKDGQEVLQLQMTCYL